MLVINLITRFKKKFKRIKTNNARNVKFKSEKKWLKIKVLEPTIAFGQRKLNEIKHKPNCGVKNIKS